MPVQAPVRKGPRLLCRAARIVGIGAIAFLSLFALDVFQPGAPPGPALIGLAIHLIPSIVLVGILVVAWHWPLIGGLLFLAVAFLPFLLLSNTPSVNGMLAAPFALTGMLFIASAIVWGRRSPA
jgi:hypothetical protein